MAAAGEPDRRRAAAGSCRQHRRPALDHARARRSGPSSRRNRDLCRKLRRPGDRQGPRSFYRSRRRSTGRRLSHGGIRRRSATGGLPGCRYADHHAATRHDDHGRQSAHLRLLCIGQRLGRASHASAIAVAGSHRRGFRRVLRLPGERRDLPGDGAAGARADAGPETQSSAVSAGRCDGIECRFDSDDNRQSAEHDDRQLFTNPLSAVRRRPGAGGAGRASADGRATGSAAPQRVCAVACRTLVCRDCGSTTC